MTGSLCGTVPRPLVRLAIVLSGLMPGLATADPPKADAAAAARDGEFEKFVKPLLARHCLECHSTKAEKGGLDLERFVTVAHVRKDVKPWQGIVEQVEAGEMPPKEKPQLSAEDKRRLLEWVKAFFAAESRARAGDPGQVPLRRLSNAEYDATIRDLTGIDLAPTKEFPVDGAGGEGFTNASESLADVSPALLARYLQAAKEIAEHVVLLPDGFRFSAAKSREEWTAEAVAAIKKAYGKMDGVTPDGSPRFIANAVDSILKHRDALAAGKFEAIADHRMQRTRAKYLELLWTALNDTTPSEPLDAIRKKWKAGDAAGLQAEVRYWQENLWRGGPVGSYVRSLTDKKHTESDLLGESTSRFMPFDPPPASSLTLRPAITVGPAQQEVVIYLAARDSGAARPLVWLRPRVEGGNKPPILLADYQKHAPTYEIDPASAFAASAKYLAAVADVAHAADAKPDELAIARGLDPAFLKQWIKVLAVVPPTAANQKPAASKVPATSALGRWLSLAATGEGRAEADRLAVEVERILSGPRPADKDPERAAYDLLVRAESPLFEGVDVLKIAKRAFPAGALGIPAERFNTPEKDGLVVPSDAVVEIRLPASLLAGRQFVVDAKLQEAAEERFVRLHAATEPPGPDTRWGGPLLAGDKSPDYQRMVTGNAEFRRLFPKIVCFPDVVPNDEIVALKMFHREDESLLRLYATDAEARELDRLWQELRFISRQAVKEYEYLPQFMEYTTQDTPKRFQQFFIDRRPVFERDAKEFLRAEEEAIPRQVDALVAFAAKAYRRPLEPWEGERLRALYETIRKQGADHREAFCGVLARIFMEPSFLFRIEQAPSGRAEPVPVSDWELASRLSYFIWSSMPDDELRQIAAAGKLRDPEVLETQARRMLKDGRIRALAVDFGMQWMHVRGIEDLKEKSETAFPQFDEKLRKAIAEESALFFQDFFQADRPVTSLIDADYCFVDETLAAHYGVPGVKGTWRRVDGAKKFGRGGILGLASVHAKQSGASRTSPVLRGNWVVETLLGEKLPRPPANVPVLPDQEGLDGLTTRQLVERHVSDPSCAGCHSRIDPLGFAFEHYDPIGRRRDKEASGRPVDTKAKLKDGTEIDGIDGLRQYLLTQKKEVFTRLFCQKLLGYALGRATTLSDTAAIDEMVAALEKNDGRISAAVVAIVRSPQFRLIRSQDMAAVD
jgi:mono/diheme cytochrome c family protein